MATERQPIPVVREVPAADLHAALMQLALVLDAAGAHYAAVSLHAGRVFVTILCPTDLACREIHEALRLHGARVTSMPHRAGYLGETWLGSGLDLDGILITINGPHSERAS